MQYPQANIIPHLNTGELRDADRVRKLLSSPDIHVAYLLGDGHHWIDYALAQPNIQLVIVRRWNPFNEPQGHNRDIDGAMHQNRTAQEVFNHFLAAGHGKYKGNKKVRWIWGWNEPSHTPHDPSKDLVQLNKWMADIARLFAQNGYGAAIGGYAVAKTNSLPIQDVATWRKAWKYVLDVLAQFPDWLHLDIHEYEFAFMAINSLIGIDTPFPFSLLDKRIINPQHWGTIPYSGPGIEHNWKLGNFANVMEYNKELGYPQFAWGRGEWGTDTMTEKWWWNDSIDGKPPLEQTWREMFGVAAKGVHTLFKYHAYLHDRPNTYTMAEHNAFIIEQAKWFKRNSGAGCLYNAHFAWNTNSLWKTEDISHPDYMPYIDWMQTQQHEADTPDIPPTEPPPPIEDKPMYPATIRSNGNYNVFIRAERSTTSVAVGKLAVNTPYTGYAADPDDKAENGYIWRKVQVSIKNTDISGYVADEFVTVAALPDTPVFYDFNLGKDTIRLSETQKAALVKALRSDATDHALVALYYEAIADYVAGIEGAA